MKCDLEKTKRRMIQMQIKVSNKLSLISKHLFLMTQWKLVHFELMCLCQILWLLLWLSSVSLGVTVSQKKKKSKEKKRMEESTFLSRCVLLGPRDTYIPSLRPRTETSPLPSSSPVQDLGSLEHLLPVGFILNVFTPVTRCFKRLQSGGHKIIRPRLINTEHERNTRTFLLFQSVWI